MEKHCVLADYTIKEVIDRFESNNDRVAIVLDLNEKVVGVVSQGDIIRAIASGKNIYVSVKNIIQPSFKYVKQKNMEEAYRYFKKYGLTLLPIVDDQYCLVDVITVQDVYEYLENKK